MAIGWTASASGKKSTPISLVTSGCGSLAELNERIARRSNQIRLVRRSGQVRGLEAEIRDLGANQKEIVLTVVKTARDRLSRRMHAQNCDEALEALALLTVLTLDPLGVVAPRRHQSRPTPAAVDPSLSARPAPRLSQESSKAPLKVPLQQTPNETPSTDSSDPGTGTPVPTPDNTTPLESADPGVPTAPRRAIPTEEESPPEIPLRAIAHPEDENDARRPNSIALAVGAGGIVMGGPAPRSLPGASVYAFWGWDRNSFWSPAIIVAAGHSERNGLAFPGGTANFSLDAVRVDLCPVSVGMHRRFGARACALGMAGALAARGVQTVDAETHRRIFALFGGSLAAIYQPGWRIELVASGSLGFPLQRYAFQFEPTVFHRVEPVSLMAGLGLGIRFH
jgi:hypothetical protein